MIEVPIPRLHRWLVNFHSRHTVLSTHYVGDTVVFVGADGEQATLRVPFGPHEITTNNAEFYPAPLFAHLEKPRMVGVLLVRRGGYAAGVFSPADELLVSKVGSRLVHGRHKKGGSSQGRFSRRRDNEVRALIVDATEVVHRILLPQVSSLDVVIVGGDRQLVGAVFGDRRLSEVHKRVTPPWLSIPDPKLAVLRAAPNHYRAVRIDLDTGNDSPGHN